MLVAIAGLVGARAASGRRPGPLAGAVAAGQGAVWAQAREGGVERVELSAGTLRVHVRPQGAGERFLVRLPDGEIEVRGTTFEVTARDGTTSHVRVDEGTVVLRLRGSPDQSLGPGTSWPASEASAAGSQEAFAGSHDAFTAGAASAVPAAPIARTAASRPRRASAAAHDGNDGAALYAEAMRSFREGRYDGAAAAFHAFTLAYPRASEAEDASFLEALSLARAGRADAAALAAERHLETFPRSFRQREAAVLVARAASHRGRCDEALQVLAPWVGGPPDADLRSVLDACGHGSAPPQ